MPDGPLPLPKTHLSIDYSNVFAAVSGEPNTPTPPELETPAGEKAIVECQFGEVKELRFRIEEALAALSQLINTKVLIRIHASDVPGAPVIATATVDMLPFACGHDEFKLDLVSLTPVEAPGAPRVIEGSLGGIHVFLTSRKKPETDGHEESDLQEPQPFSFISPQDVKDGANVIEVEIAGLQSIPLTLQGAADLVCGKDGQQGKVSFMAGILMPAPAPTIAIQGRISSGQVIFDGPMRFLLSADGAEVLRAHLEAGKQLAVEIARYVQCQDTLVDNSWNSYHALATIPTSDHLIQEDCKVLVCESASLAAWQANQQSCLPPFVEKPGGGKAKPIEPEAEAFAWSQSLLSNIKISLMVSPLVPLWQAPAAPSQSIIDLIPTRDLNPSPPPLDPSADFRAQVNAALTSLAQAYNEHGDVPRNQLPIPQKHKSLIFGLNKSGTYLSLRESFKPAIERIVREKMAGGKDIITQPSLMSSHYSPLYKNLLDLIHLEIFSVGDTAPKPKASQPLLHDESARLVKLALEYEDHGRWLSFNQGGSGIKSQELLSRARDIHRKRLIDGNNTSLVWIDAASFSLRTGDLPSGVSALCSALEIDPSNKDALIKISLSTLEQVIAVGDDADVTPLYDVALAAAHALVELSNEDDEALNWALLALTFTKDRSQSGASRNNTPWMQCRQKLSTMERCALAAGQSAESSNGFFQLWSHAREMKLPLVSREIESLVPILQQSSNSLRDRSAAAAVETAFLGLTSQHEELSRIISEAKKVARRITSSDSSDLYKILMVQADAYQRIGLIDESILALQKAKCHAADTRNILSSNLRLAETFLGLSKLRSDHNISTYARDTLLSAADHECIRFSHLSWCLLGLASLDDETISSKSFQEANKIDTELTTPWVYLALIETRGQRWNEASSALSRSFQLGVFDEAALSSIASLYETAGKWREASNILSKVLSIQLGQDNNLDTRQRLIHCQLCLKNAKQAFDLNGDYDSEVMDQAQSLPVDDF